MPDKAEFRARQQRAREWREFRTKELLLSQRRFALLFRLSRREVQAIEAGNVTPHLSTLLRWKELKATYNTRKVKPNE
jgi:predicted transcriptional regulator